MTEIESIVVLGVIIAVFVFCIGVLCGCRAPAVLVQKIYVVHQYGERDNSVGVEVLKDETISPQVKASVK